MDHGTVIDIAQNALLTVLFISAPILGLSLVVGLAVSIIQATTQIQEHTLTFVPKMIAVFGSILIFGPWILRKLTEYTLDLYTNINLYIR